MSLNELESLDGDLKLSDMLEIKINIFFKL